jgi:hypothetical protein
MTEIVYFDDSADDRSKYGKRLRNAHLHVTELPPPKTFDLRAVKRLRPDLFLVDYELTKARNKDEQVNYFGGTLGTALREVFPEHPIALLTRRNLVSQPAYRQLNEIKQAFDELLYKDEIEANPTLSAKRLTSLANGFEFLRRLGKKNWASLVRSLKANTVQADSLLTTGPPFVNPREASSPEWRVQDAARWIRRVVLHYPGILYDELHASGALGIDVRSFRGRRVREYFSSAEFEGVFSDVEKRWWRNKLFDKAQAVIAKAGLSGPASTVFGPAFRKVFRSSLKPAVCIWSGLKFADCVCYVLQKPVRREFSLPYHPDDRPSVMDEARVSFKAIRESNRVSDELFDEQNQALLEQIRDGKK